MPRISQDDLITESAAIASPKQQVRCARPGCPQVFIPYRTTHKYCSARCKKTVMAYSYALNGGR